MNQARNVSEGGQPPLNLHVFDFQVCKSQRSEQKGQKPLVLWFTGLSGAGKSTIANLVDRRLHALGKHAYVIDGDHIRLGLNRDLGFTNSDRAENIRRVAEVAKLMVDAGLIVITAFISPYRAERALARSLFGAGEFVEIFVDTPLTVAERRDVKGLYRKARAGIIPNFTGVNAPYEPPEHPEVLIRTDDCSPEDAAEGVIRYIGLGSPALPLRSLQASVS